MSASLTLRFRRASAVSRIAFATRGLAGLGAFACGVAPARAALLVTDRRVGALHGAAARRSLERAGYDVATLVLPAGERTKRPAALARVWSACAAARLGRSEPVVALGGGVIGDLAGFAASTWQRGTPWIAVPTTLLAQVDASVGGKTAVDLAEGKNLAGSFHQPAGVYVDSAVLDTLPPRHFRAGLAEIAKIAFACDAAFFRGLERSAAALALRERRAVRATIERAIRLKARVVLADETEREGGPRTALNFGHTLAHALEAALDYRGLLHGEAVAIGCRVAAALSVEAAGLAPRDRARLEALLDLFGLPDRIPGLRVPALEAAMALDKKRARAGVRWVLTPRIGFASVPRLIESRLVRAALREAGARS